MVPSRQSLGARALAPLLIFLLGAAISAAAGLWLQRSNQLHAIDDFERAVERVNREISHRFVTPVYGLNGARGLYAGSTQVDRATFRAYVESRDLAQEFPGVRGFGFIERVTPDLLPEFLKAQQVGGVPEFKMHRLRDGDSSEHYIIKFIEPETQNESSLGLDIGSEVRRRVAAQQAIDSGLPTITAPITLVHDQRRLPGVLLFLPVYEHQATPGNLAERRATLVGLLFAPIVINDLLKDIAEIHRDRIRFQLFDSADDSQLEFQVFDSVESPDAAVSDSLFSKQVALLLPGRTLTLKIDSSAQFDAEVSSSIPWAVFVAGLLASTLLALLLQQQSSGLIRGEVLAGQMTADLDRLALVARRTSNAVAITDAQQRITWVNLGFERITGYPESQAVGQTLDLLRHDGSDADTLYRLDQALQAGAPFTGTLVRHRSDGRPYWTETEIQPLRDARDGLSGFMVIESDITDRKRAEAAQQRMGVDLRRNNELLSSILENLPCGLSVFDNDLKLVIANRQFRALLRFPDLLFEPPVIRFEDFVRFNAEQGAYGSGDVESRIRSIVDRARGNHVAQQLDRMPLEQSMLEIRSAPLPGGGFVSTYSDVSSRIKAETEVKRSAELLRGAIDAIGEAFVVYDADDRLMFYNEKYDEIYRPLPGVLIPGARFEDVVRSGAESGRIPAAVGRVDEWVAERVAEHHAGHATLTQQLDDGRTLRVVDRKMPDGHTVGFRIDVTELMKATETAQAASREKSQFLANTSHEIRTPMNAILGMLALLSKTGLTPQQADYAQKTESAARSLLGLLNDILDFSKIEAGKMALDSHPFSTDQMLRDLSVILGAHIGSKRVEVLFDVDAQLPPCLIGDAMRLNQVLINLGSNAIKFTAAGEVVVSLKVEAIDEKNASLLVAVSDTGIGISLENQARIFSAFTQGEASTTRRFGGTGLGLSISHRLVDLMGGTLQIESAVGQGSRFDFRIQLPIGRGANVAELADEADAPAPAMRVLMIDDNPTAREVLDRMGKSLGWQVDLAESGKGGLESLRNAVAEGAPYQAVFVDWLMPSMDGWQTSRRIHELGLAGQAPVVIMVTAHGRAMMNLRASDEQALIDRFLVKPVTASMLAEAVADARSHKASPARARSTPSTTQRLAGLRLLVVEDNPNNQQIARELLEAEGASVQIAGDGQQGVEAVAAAERGFDLILMDLQMPVLDGFAATSRIRQDLGMQDLPIVAMTANAMATDREACIAVGMNDHIGKPFDLDNLVRIVRQHAGRGEVPMAAVTESTTLPSPVADAAAAAGVDIATAISRLGGRQDTYERMLRAFVKELVSMRRQLAEMCDGGDVQGLARLLHTLKGLAATFGATALSATAAQCERQLGADKSRAAMQLAAQSTRHAIDVASPGLGALLLTLKPGLDEGSAATPGGNAADRQAIRSALLKLAELLRHADPHLVQVHGDLRRKTAGLRDERLAALDKSITGHDYQAALVYCDQLIESYRR